MGDSPATADRISWLVRVHTPTFRADFRRCSMSTHTASDSMRRSKSPCAAGNQFSENRYNDRYNNNHTTLACSVTSVVRPAKKKTAAKKSRAGATICSVLLNAVRRRTQLRLHSVRRSKRTQRRGSLFLRCEGETIRPSRSQVPVRRTQICIT